MEPPAPVARLLSVQAGRVGTILSGTERIATAYRKGPVDGRVRVGRLGLEGDEHADPRGHGGERKAVYLYSADHYPHWRSTLGDPGLAHGAFGENLTVERIDESSVHLGDRLEIGSVGFEVTQPRLPCFKMNAAFGRPEMMDRFFDFGHSGFYLAVPVPGELGRDDLVKVVHPGPCEVTVAEEFSRRRTKARTG